MTGNFEREEERGITLLFLVRDSNLNKNDCSGRLPARRCQGQVTVIFSICCCCFCIRSCFQERSMLPGSSSVLFQWRR